MTDAHLPSGPESTGSESTGPESTGPESTGRGASNDAPDWQEFVATVYQELRARAHQCMRAERGDHTLQATALVHEAYLRLARGDERRTWRQAVRRPAVHARRGGPLGEDKLRRRRTRAR